MIQLKQINISFIKFKNYSTLLKNENSSNNKDDNNNQVLPNIYEIWKIFFYFMSYIHSVNLLIKLFQNYDFKSVSIFLM
jgi:hypothetical protein